MSVLGQPSSRIVSMSSAIFSILSTFRLYKLTQRAGLPAIGARPSGSRPVAPNATSIAGLASDSRTKVRLSLGHVAGIDEEHSCRVVSTRIRSRAHKKTFVATEFEDPSLLTAVVDNDDHSPHPWAVRNRGGLNVINAGKASHPRTLRLSLFRDKRVELTRPSRTITFWLLIG